MVGSSILPVAFHKNKLYFLFGKENELDNTPGWSDFGGGIEPDESIYNTAIREGGEELSGFLGDAKQIDKLIKKGGKYVINHKNEYHCHLFKMDFNESLPKYYNQSHDFLWKKMDVSNRRSVLFEKIEIRWMTVQDMKKNRSKFRSFYQEIVDHILDEIPNIKRKLCLRKTACNKTKGLLRKHNVTNKR